MSHREIGHWNDYVATEAICSYPGARPGTVERPGRIKSAPLMVLSRRPAVRGGGNEGSAELCNAELGMLGRDLGCRATLQRRSQSQQRCRSGPLGLLPGPGELEHLCLG